MPEWEHHAAPLALRRRGLGGHGVCGLRAFCRGVIFLLSVSRLYTRPGLSVFSFAAVCPSQGSCMDGRLVQ